MGHSREEYQCRVCSAHATGFHFEAQSCSACCAFFRRAVSLNRSYKCMNGYSVSSVEMCPISYQEQKICRACRLRKCITVGMKKSSVQGPKPQKTRSYTTDSGLRRNKRFRLAKSTPNLFISTSLTSSNVTDNGHDSADNNDPEIPTPETILSNGECGEKCLTTDQDGTSAQPTAPSMDRMRKNSDNLLSIFIDEEMRIAERRRIMFCDGPVGSLLGTSKACPFTAADIKPLRFRDFRKSIRTHILLIYEWLRVWPQFSDLCHDDKITFLRKCVLYHTILDPCYITVQMRDPTKFVLQNGGYISTVSDCDDGWHDEKEISRDIKKRIYLPLLDRVMHIITQMAKLELTFEEFVALKALVSFQFTIPDVSKASQLKMKKELGDLCRALYGHYFETENEMDRAERFGNIILLTSTIFDTATNFVESHHQVQFFDLWQLDSLLLQFLKKMN
ncbi:ligand-binding domain of nuclear hormone receptor domain-containing protein [Ditylenchus destructor]|uniref:Ligand-binding domain of nuclear hormone receptor domain-containing protein n=1 Tax=Ditylenchus destructor TaxID=166010 RepID=A0AAD4NFJ5_9BILA|nr:ligand-binding domain of nuclear hormone receptor domain-containing protein [Ditylenchus destructor]